MKVKAIEFLQGGSKLYVTAIDAAKLWDVVKVNQREDDKEDGYQRALSASRADDIKKFVLKKNVLAPAIIIAFETKHVSFDEKKSELIIADVENAGWVIDGQHRLRGAQLAALENPNEDVTLPVVAFLGLSQASQISQFVTINKEAKGVPTSLYYDLLKMMPNKKNNNEIAKEKAAAIAEQLRKDEKSAFFDRIVVVTSPKKGELSLNNFVRKIYPLLTEGKGAFEHYSQHEMCGIIDNYFNALKAVFPNEFSLYKERFFQTLGFGAMINALVTIFNSTLKEYQGFTLNDAINSLNKISDFQFSDWDKIGSGSAAEIQAGKDIETYYKMKLADVGQSTSILRL